MEITVYNPQKGRLETIDVEFTDNNTTWFDNCEDAHDIYMITDFEGGLLISEFGYSNPLWIYDTSISDIGNNRRKAFEMRQKYE